MFLTVDIHIATQLTTTVIPTVAMLDTDQAAITTTTGTKHLFVRLIAKNAFDFVAAKSRAFFLFSLYRTDMRESLGSPSTR